MTSRITILVTVMLVLAISNYSIVQRENILRHGQVVLLELAPVDPRSLMQGDFMALRYKMPLEVFSQRETKIMQDGIMVLNLDKNNVASFSHFDNTDTLTDNQVRFQYRIRNGVPKMASDAFFFEEGRADEFAEAHYGEFRVNAEGIAILTGLRDRQFNLLGQQPHSK